MLGRQADHVREIHVVDWSRERFTVPRHPAYRTSTDTFGAAVFQQPVHDRVHWASTETATAYAGHIEGAVRAGLSAAKTIARTVRGERR
ncbi:FAD-dependent oxidoreductase [Micromonospora sp. NPDC048063]|uniref:FAD-dependent oxidoreductase n=1 Tax=Micromonospora sp. NPDC048063 TaxID=3364256 RepID=UPI00371A70EA